MRPADTSLAALRRKGLRHAQREQLERARRREARLTPAEDGARFMFVPGYDPEWPVFNLERINEPGWQHHGHRTHMHGSHGGGTQCSCGATLGVTCYVSPMDAEGNWLTPPPCPECRLNGVGDGR